ncbi:hypothetical protein ACMFMF_007174 [Clarireedia jacksonii]
MAILLQFSLAIPQPRNTKQQASAISQNYTEPTLYASALEDYQQQCLRSQDSMWMIRGLDEKNQAAPSAIKSLKAGHVDYYVGFGPGAFVAEESGSGELLRLAVVPNLI